MPTGSPPPCGNSRDPPCSSVASAAQYTGRPRGGCRAAAPLDELGDARRGLERAQPVFAGDDRPAAVPRGVDEGTDLVQEGVSRVEAALLQVHLRQYALRDDGRLAHDR